MIVAISGASGFIGRRLATVLADAGHVIRRFVRGVKPDAADGVIAWDPASGALDPSALRGVDAVINLAGEPIAQRWTADRKRRIRESRIRATDAIARAIATADQPPRVLLSGSAIGFYGDRGDEMLDEASTAGSDFLASVTVDWEEAVGPARDAGARVVALRTGMVLGADGGALAKLLPPFGAGLGGPFGSGLQWMSWIAREDLARAILFLLQTPAASGPVNLVSPNPVRNTDFVHTLGHVLRRPAVLSAPAFALTLMFGEMARVALLASQRVAPKRLGELGFSFRFPLLAEALRSELDRR